MPLYFDFIPFQLLLHGFYHGFLGVQKNDIVKITHQMAVVLPHFLSLMQDLFPQQDFVLPQLLQFIPDDLFHFVKVCQFLLKIAFFHLRSPFPALYAICNCPETSIQLQFDYSLPGSLITRLVIRPFFCYNRYRQKDIPFLND